MKTNFKRIGKQSISIVLAVMMMLSTMLVGMVTSNAADTFTKGSTLYFDTKAINQGNERWAAYFFNSDTDNAWVDCTAVPNDNKIYSVTVPGSYANVIFCRMDKAQTENGWGDMLWNQSNDLKASEATGNEYVSTGWVSGSNKFTGEWKTYADPNTTHKVTANFSNATVKLGDKTLTSGTAVTVDNDKSYTLTVEPNSGYSLSKVMQGSTDLGTSGAYTLAAGTDDVTIDITTDNTTENDYDFYVTGYMGKDLTTGDNYKFTKESNGIYTCTMKLTGYLHVTITDKIANKVYWAKSHEKLSENTYSTETVVETGGDKWEISCMPGNEIKITFNITAGISNGKIKWEYAVADPVSVELNADLVDGSAAYISSYTDNDTGNIVTNTDETVQSVNAKPGTSVTFKAKSVDGYFPKWKFEGKFSTGDTYTLDASSVTGTTVTVYLTYEKIENHNIIVASNKGGNVSYTYNGTAGTVAEGTTSSAISVASNSTITLKANAVKDYVFSGWEFDNESNVVFATGQDSFSTSITINVVGDVKVTATGAIAQMYIRKQNIFTEKKIYPYARMEDLRLDLLPKIRIMAQNHAGGHHPWTGMDDQELLKKIREQAYAYFHGHEVGGTNPSLLEALASTDLNLLLDVGFNREVAEDGALYWNKGDGNLAGLIDQCEYISGTERQDISLKAKKRIEEEYSWKYICDKYFKVLSVTKG